MSRKWIASFAVLAIAGATTVAASAVLGNGATARPSYATVTIDVGAQAATARPRAAAGSGGPKLLYLQSSTPTTINPADPAAGGLGPYVDVRLKGCSKVLGGGVVPLSTDVFIQGSYVESPSKFHVLLGLDDAAAAASPRVPFQINTNLTCLKGVK
ncbi:MAG: hypothetical protein ACHQJ5_10600 [Vicinamibacteria bacterium]|jgi:ABC-type transport system substrate-binding protein